MSGADLERRALPQRKHADRARAGAIDANQRFRANSPGPGGPEQDMASINRADLDSRSPRENSLDPGWFCCRDSICGRVDGLPAQEERKTCRVDAEYSRPVAGHGVHHVLERPRLDDANRGRVNGRDRARVALGERDQVLVCLLDRAEALAQPGDGPFLEVNDLPHGDKR